MFETIVNADGTISIVPVTQTNNLPFTSMGTMDAANQFPILPGSSTLPLNAFKNTVAPMRVNTGITASSAAIPFEKDPIAIAQGFVKGSPSDISFSPFGIDTSFGVANEEDVEQVDYLDSKPNKFQTGIAKLFEFLQRFSPAGNIARGIESIRNRFDTRKAIQRDIQRDTQGEPITTFRNQKQREQDRIDDRGRGQIPSRTTSAPKKSSSAYSEAKRSFFRD
jgi:hypothetical protein